MHCRNWLPPAPAPATQWLAAPHLQTHTVYKPTNIITAQALEEAALALGLCGTGGSMLP